MADDSNELCFTPAVRLKELIRARDVSPTEIVTAVLEQIDRVNPHVNAYCTLTAEQALIDAKNVESRMAKGELVGPLAGIPVSIKDLMRMKGVRSTSGSRVFRDYIGEEDAPTVERLKAADAIIVGKTNTPEFGWRATTYSRVFGETKNPWNLERTAGGSSGGASAAVATGMAPLALGSDGGGSIRIPSAFCGTFGHKPSFGRVPMYPASGNELQAHAGPMTRTVADAALMLDVIHGADDRDRNSLPTYTGRYVGEIGRGVDGLRIAWSPDLNFAPVEPEIRDLTAAAVERLQRAGWNIEEDSPDVEDPFPAFDVLYRSAQGGSLLHTFDEWKDDLDPGLVELVEASRHITAFEHARAHLERAFFWDKMRKFMSNYDALITPAVPITAFELGIVGPTSVAGQPVGHLGFSPFSFPFNLTGQPASIVPCGFASDGLTVGLQIVGRRHDDATVLRVASAYEDLTQFAEHRPPMDYLS
jgi:aspartyl-tRNA(Asn)/glutamyl-tRNA(Gln) amidotransferase subunit A